MQIVINHIIIFSIFNILCSTIVLFFLGISSWQHPVLLLHDVTFLDLYTILEFIYMGEVTVAKTNLTSFLKTAELLQIKGLAENTATWDQEQNVAEYIGCCGDSPTGAFAWASASGIGGQDIDSIVSRPALNKDDIKDMEFINYQDDNNNLYVDDNHKKCQTCGIVILKKNFPRHFRDMHTGPKPRSLCPLCQKSFKTSDWLKDHIRRGHGYTKELTDQLMATLKTTTRTITHTTTEATTEEKIYSVVSLATIGDTVTNNLSNEMIIKPSLVLID